jgi:stage III sporulation protein AA
MNSRELELSYAEQVSKKFERTLLPFLPKYISSSLRNIQGNKLSMLEEIRLRAQNAVMLSTGYGQVFLGSDGTFVKNSEEALTISADDINKTLEMMCEFSVYAFGEDIKNGFITLKGGHRVGISGRAVTDSGNIKTLKDISSLNIRISKEVLGCANKVIRYIIKDSKSIYNTLIISPPKCGKTTILRDITRLLSDGSREMDFESKKVSLIDERSEIAACYKGIPQNQVGICLNRIVPDICHASHEISYLPATFTKDLFIIDVQRAAKPGH